jgi:hypothetical protein
LALGSAGRDEEELAGWPTASFKSRKRAGVGADMSSGNYPRQVPVRMCCCVWSQEICGCSSELWALMMRYELLGRCCLGSELGRAGEGEEKTATDDTVKVNTETEAWWFSGQRLRPQEIALGLLPCDTESGVLLSAVGDEFRCFCPSGNVGGSSSQWPARHCWSCRVWSTGLGSRASFPPPPSSACPEMELWMVGVLSVTQATPIRPAARRGTEEKDRHGDRGSRAQTSKAVM